MVSLGGALTLSEPKAHLYPHFIISAYECHMKSPNSVFMLAELGLLFLHYINNHTIPYQFSCQDGLLQPIVLTPKAPSMPFQAEFHNIPGNLSEYQGQ